MVHEGVGTRRWPIEGDEQFSFVLDEQRVLRAGEMCRWWLSIDGQDSEQSSVDVKRMRHADRRDLPDLSRSELRSRYRCVPCQTVSRLSR